MRLPLSSGIVLKLPSNNLIFTLVFFTNSQDNGRAEDISVVLLWEWGFVVFLRFFMLTLFGVLESFFTSLFLYNI